MGMLIESRGALERCRKVKTLSKPGLDQGAGMTGCRTIGHDARPPCPRIPSWRRSNKAPTKDTNHESTRISSPPQTKSVCETNLRHQTIHIIDAILAKLRICLVPYVRPASKLVEAWCPPVPPCSGRP